MAVYTEQIQKLYVAYFNRPADYEGLAFWEKVLTANGGNVDAVSAFFAQSPEYKDQNAGKSYYQIVNQIYLNLFNREADVPGLEHWSGLLRNGTFTVDKIVKIIADSASNTDAQDKTTYLNKVAAATAFTAELNTASEIIGYSGAKANEAAKVWLSTVLGTQASLDAAIAPAALANTVNKVAQTGLAQEGTTYNLTKGLDSITGTSGNDTIVGSISSGATGNAELNTLSGIDAINGGTGIDTLKLAHDQGTIDLGNLSNIEVVEIASATAVTVNTTAVAGLTDLNITKANGAIIATAAATTDVDVSMADAATVGSITVNGAKDVNVVLTNAVSDIDVGALGADAAGAVTISTTGAAIVNNSGNVTLGDIAVGGGTTVSVTQKATVNTAAMIADGGVESVTQGNVSVTAGAATTAVTVKQDATNNGASSRAAVAGATEVATVKFAALKATESVTVGGLTFTAAKDLTAAEVAQAFANIATSAIKPTQIAPAATATGDTNGSSVAANGIFTGSLASLAVAADPGATPPVVAAVGNSAWTSGAANGDTVTFTGRANTFQVDLTASASAGVTAPVVTTTTQGVDAVSARNNLGITAGLVTVTGGAALKSVTVDGYDSVTTAGTPPTTTLSSIGGASNAALATVTLANGNGFNIASAAATLALNLTDVDGTVNVAAGTKTLNATVNGDFTVATLASASAEAVNVAGTGNVAGTAGAGNLAAATSINTSAMTAGSAEFTIADGGKTSYTGGAAADYVTVSNANTAVTKAISLGAGNDWLNLQATAGNNVAVPTATLSGGEGTDIIALNGASAQALSANGDFAGKIEGFEKLEITDVVSAATTVNMANMDGINYVVTNGSTSATASTGNKQVYAFDIAGLQIDTGATLRFGGAILATAAADNSDAATIAGLIPATVTIAGVEYNVTKSGTAITLTSVNNVAPQTSASLSTTGTVDSTFTSTAVTVTAGVADVVGGVPYLTIDKMANNSTVELVEDSAGVIVKMADATGTADTLNIVTTVVSTAKNFGTVTADGVEAIKINAVDAQPVNPSTGAASIQRGTLALDADKATSVTISGNSHVTLSLVGDTKSVATVDASTLTGGLNFAASGAEGVVAVTVTGGSGADVLRASVGANAKADVLTGGAGADTLYVGSNGAKLTGGDGNDLFIVTGLTGNKEGNTYSEITDFKAGDLLQLQAFTGGTLNTTTGIYTGGTAADVSALGKLTATLNETTASFSNFVDAATKQANLGAAVWFNYKGDLYVVVDNNVDSDTFQNGADMIVKLTGINGDNLSWNSDFGTAALV